jgi:hypothetical protein
MNFIGGSVASPSTQMTLDNTGNVGIGTSSPTDVLDVRGGIRSTDGTTTSRIISSGNTCFIGSLTAAPIVFQVNNTERMRIDSSGNLLVGTTATGQSNTQGFAFNALTGAYLSVGHASGTASGQPYLSFSLDGVAIGSVTQNGTTGVLFNITSDYRLKNNATPLAGATEFIMALQPKSWDWVDGSGKGVGFIAHEFMEVAKYSGNGKKDAVDAEGKPAYQSIQPSSSEVMANLVALVQELKAELDVVKAELNTLKGN